MEILSNRTLRKVYHNYRNQNSTGNPPCRGQPHSDDYYTAIIDVEICLNCDFPTCNSSRDQTFHKILIRGNLKKATSCTAPAWQDIRATQILHFLRNSVSFIIHLQLLQLDNWFSSFKMAGLRSGIALTAMMMMTVALCDLAPSVQAASSLPRSKHFSCLLLVIFHISVLIGYWQLC